MSLAGMLPHGHDLHGRAHTASKAEHMRHGRFPCDCVRPRSLLADAKPKVLLCMGGYPRDLWEGPNDHMMIFNGDEECKQISVNTAISDRPRADLRYCST